MSASPGKVSMDKSWESRAGEDVRKDEMSSDQIDVVKEPTTKSTRESFVRLLRRVASTSSVAPHPAAVKSKQKRMLTGFIFQTLLPILITCFRRSAIGFISTS
jgi:hypothetical protein